MVNELMSCDFNRKESSLRWLVLFLASFSSVSLTHKIYSLELITA